MSRIVHGSFTVDKAPLDLAGAAAAAVDAMKALARDKQVGIELVSEGGPVMVAGDEQRLQQLVWNLIGNAVKFSHRGGLVLVTLRRSGVAAELEVKDQGVGIAPDFLPHVFDRFRQGMSGPRAGGLGLGLSIARHIAVAHGGTLDGSSAGVGQGATFTVRLPLLTA
jgi:signal transduction histidine kinase